MASNDKTETPVEEFQFPEPSNTMFHLTCKNHPEMLYLTKNPYSRGLHFLGTEQSRFASECPCPFQDLMVATPSTPNSDGA